MQSLGTFLGQIEGLLRHTSMQSVLREARMLKYLWHLLFGSKLCIACHEYSAAANSLCLYCQLKGALLRRAG
jgi:hypothetical protein